MTVRPLLAIAFATLLLVPAKAAPLQMMFAGSTYEPGSPLLFTIILPTGIADLGAYEIQIVITGDTPTAGVDYGFDLGATEAATSNYLFASDDQFLDVLQPDTTMSERILLTDFVLSPGVDVSAGVNDHVADVVIYTADNYVGSLTIFIDSDSLILDTASGAEVDQIASIRSDTAASSLIRFTAIPEPGGTVAGLIVWVASFCRRRRC